jgi:hypothetical protein
MKALSLFISSFLFMACNPVRNSTSVKLPSWIKGEFTDDYGIPYTINDSLFKLGSSARYHILLFNEKEQYLVVKNDEINPSEKGLYSRIDYMQFTDMKPYTWCFCLIIYNAPDTTTAKKFMSADRKNPKKGCNGFPFSRMKRTM